jgi:hypothetical protein
MIWGRNSFVQEWRSFGVSAKVRERRPHLTSKKLAHAVINAWAILCHVRPI